MLMEKKRLENKQVKRFAHLLFISCITFQSLAFADIKTQTAEEFRALGYVEQKKGNLNEALSYYSKAISLGVNDPAVLNDMGVLYEQINILPRAEQYYYEAIRADEHYLPPYMNLAYLYQRIGNDEKAFEYFRRRYELGGPDDSWAQQAKEELLKIKPNYKAWVLTLESERLQRKVVQKAHQEFQERVKRSVGHFDKGEEFFEKGDYQQAIQEFDKSLRLAPDNPKVVDARNKAMVELAKDTIREQSEQAIKRLNSGDTISAQSEIKKMLTTIPNKPIPVSR
ncbi:MAG: tetratricopeptide repeat protein [Candidatus Omnitrophica bacterium]|nr:tetratricopeptide repeat protein [Candidatus Omnitrophota bacterium]